MNYFRRVIVMKHRTRFVVSLFVLILAGCNLDATTTPQVVIVNSEGTPIATGAPSVAETAQATAIPTETPVPTLTVAPDVALLAAERSMLNGYYETAVLTYETVLAQGDTVPAEMRASAAFGLGQSAVREGLFQQAVTALSTFIEDFPNDDRVPQAHFLRGDAYLGLSDWTAAISDFRTYLDLRPDLLNSYALERIADAELALGQESAALESYKAAAEASRGLVPWLALRERVAQIYSANGRYDEALAQYDAILEVAQNAPYRAGIELLAARTLINDGELEAGLDRLEHIFTEYADRPEAYHAMQTLLENERSLDSMARARVAYAYGDYQGAIEALNQYTTERPITEVPAEVHLMRGRAYREIGNTQAALTSFQTIINQYTTDPLFGQALLEQGRTAFIGGDIPGAIERYLAIANTYDYLPEAAEALWRAGYLQATNGEPDKARPIFERLADTYPDAEQAADGLFLAASAAFNAGDVAAAERYYGELASKTTGEDRADALMQAGRLALERGDTAAAMQAFQQAAESAPDSYYGARARDIITGQEAFAPPAVTTFQFDNAAEIREAENWLRETFDITQEGSLWALSPTLENDARIVRGRELWAVAAYDEARSEFSDIIDAYKDDALASYQLAIFLRGIGAYNASILAAANIILAADVGTLDAPPFIARMRYPAYYLDVVQDASTRHNLDPLLLYSLIRHESLFDTNATAAAGEKGLTQVIPSTAEYIASQLRWDNYQHTDLFRPYAGIEFGAFFLSEQVQRFDGNVTAALAGYNAGPGRAQQWLEASGGDHDLLLNAITIDSTRVYVQRIYGYYNIYRTLYGTTQ
jgi:soluble lytic murein transglycosylase